MATMHLLQMMKNAGKRAWRGSDQSLPIHSSRSPSITCRGKPISREELFTYTNGRFLVNEANATKRRYVRFDLDQLCKVAAAVEPASPIQSIEKMEGGFSKALLMRKEDGSELVAKIPFPIAGPPKYLTSSEVAVLQFLRTHTKFPVPKVFAWNSDASNPVGAEYIIMEKASGVQLFHKWSNMNDFQRFKLVQGITKLEGEIAAVCFPANGSLYFRKSLTQDEPCIMLSHDVDPSEEYCIGPSCERNWYTLAPEVEKSLIPQLNRGPWSNMSSFGVAIVEREVARIKHQDLTKTSMPGLPYVSIEEQLAVLEMARKVMSMLDTGTVVDSFSKPMLYHTDLHLGNMFVSEEDPTKLMSVIDWQSVSVSPMLIQSRFPIFLDVDETYILGSPMPELPPDYETMDAGDKEAAKYKVMRDTAARAYEVSSAVYNKKPYKSLSLPPFLQNLFVRCEAASEGNVIPLRECLIQLAEIWDDLRFKDKCPITFSEGELEKHSRELEQYKEFHGILEIACKVLNTDPEGWIAPYFDFEWLSRKNKELFEDFVRQCGENNKSPEEACGMWPFIET